MLKYLSIRNIHRNYAPKLRHIKALAFVLLLVKIWKIFKHNTETKG